MACTRKTKTLVSTCVILSGMTNIVCLLYVGWVTNYIANIYIKVPMPVSERKLEGDKRGDTVRIMERLDRLENVVNQHIQGKSSFPRPFETFNTSLPFVQPYKKCCFEHLQQGDLGFHSDKERTVLPENVELCWKCRKFHN